MASTKPSKPTASTQELRLATTMTGGVSLAIWMAGVAREINLLAQASQWRRLGGEFPTRGKLTAPAVESLKLYAALIELLDVVVDVDVLSGTSAGGINAALLASSRVSGADLGSLRDIWLDLGALIDLLRDPTDKSTPSLLYGDERMLAALIDEIPKLKTGPFPPSVFPEKARRRSTTLYVTTTLLNGEASRFTDSYGTLVQDVDRRGLFTFTEVDLAKESTVPALALAARSSASFPAAFEPSFVPFNVGTAANGHVPARPPMGSFANITRPHWVADGGLLDNQPIDVLLKRVFDRPAKRPVRRVLLFVVPSSGPSADLMEEPPPDDVKQPLGLAEALLKDLSAITTQSIAADLQAIRTHQDRMEARADGKLRLAELAASLPEGTRLITPALLQDYKKREATKQAQALTGALLRQLSTWPPESIPSAKSIPRQWESELSIGGDAEKICRRTIKEWILAQWSQPTELPENPADLARYGESAFDLAKACALSVVRAAYQLAKPDDNNAALADLTEGIHRAYEPPPPTDVAKLACEACTDEVVRGGQLTDAAVKLAEKYLDRSVVPAAAWEGLGKALVDGRNTLAKLAGGAAGGQLGTYLKYLGSQSNPVALARQLFDLAATQRAMLPAEADVEQPLEFVQVSADTRSLLAPKFQTADQKLTGMQLHHFGAFYKRSWRANDWMWGRLDGAGWLVHILLDPRRLRWIVQARAQDRQPNESNAAWFLNKLKDLAELPLPSPGYPVLATGGEDAVEELTEHDLLSELRFLDDVSEAMPPSIPKTSLWLAQAWQQRVLDEELNVLAETVIGPQQPVNVPEWSPAESREWAAEILAAPAGDAKYGLLKKDPVARETFCTDQSSPLMARTLTKAAATASAAAGSVRQLPGILKPPLATLRTLTLGGYRVVSVTRGCAKRSILIGAALLVLGVAFAIPSATLFGVAGLLMAAIGAYAIVLGTWQLSSRTLFAALSVTLVLLVFSLTTPTVREWLFGTHEIPGLVGKHVYWLGTQWWHPLVVVGAIAVVGIVLGAANPRRK